MANALGFTFYPQDWWSSDSFYEFNAFERYIYLECLFIMYRNDGYMKTQKTQFENRTRLIVDDETWQKVTDKFVQNECGFTSETVNKRLKKARISRENGEKGGRPPKENPENPTYKPKEKEKVKEKGKKNIVFGRGDKIVTIKPKYLNEPIIKIHDLKVYFESTGQLQQFLDSGWVHFDAFMDDNPGNVFDEPGHLYNTFRNFSIRYTPPARAPNKFEGAAYNKTLWTVEAWEKQYKKQLQDPEFRKHFGYGELQNGLPVGSGNNGR